jgi:hypothetical protein
MEYGYEYGWILWWTCLPAASVMRRLHESVFISFMDANQEH